jgi:hypothetical protein
MVGLTAHPAGDQDRGVEAARRREVTNMHDSLGAAVGGSAASCAVST